MRGEKEAVADMYRSPVIREDLFSIKEVGDLTGLSRSMLIKLEDIGFVRPREVKPGSGYRYYDTFNVFKILQYKRLRLAGLSQKDILNYYSMGNEVIRDKIDELKEKRRLLDQSIMLLELRTRTEDQNRFSFYDFREMTCLVAEESVRNLEEVNVIAYNLSVEALSRRLKPSISEEIFLENRGKTKLIQGAGEIRTKIYQPIEDDGTVDKNAPAIETVPACHTFSTLLYGLHDMKDSAASLLLLQEEMKKRGLTPTGEPPRVQAIVARYTAMHLSENEHVFRIAVPIEPPRQGSSYEGNT